VKITILSPYFPPEMGAPPARLYELALRLKSYGHEISVVTAFPNRPHGWIYEGYRDKTRMIEDMDGIRVIRTWIKPFAASASFIARTINDLSWTWSSSWMTSRLLGKQDVLLVQNPPLFSIFSAKRLKRKTGAKIVMWCGDVWPDVLVLGGQLQPGVLVLFMRRLQQYCFKHSDMLAVTNPKTQKDVQQAYQCPMTTVWSNGVDSTLFDPRKRSVEIRRSFSVGDDELLIGFVGLHGPFQGLDAILDAASILQSESRFKFICIGEGVEKIRLKEKAAKLRLANVIFHDSRPKEEMPGIVASCDVSVVSLSARMPGTMPSKFYEALAAGSIPLVADGCEAAALVATYNAGVVYEPMDGQSAADALIELSKKTEDERKQIRSNAVALAKRFDREKLARFVESSLTALVNDEPLPRVDW
jgi:glycosyltransferase involved in cell wall biosynthesis